MKLLLSFCSSLLLSASLFSAPTQCEGHYFGNEAPDILNAKLLPKTQELCYGSFAIMHSGISRTPLWSAEHLTKEGLRHKSKRTNDFHPEERLNGDERAELSDYARSGYDRGHMAPAADMSDKKSQHECFTLANMIPQNSQNNRGIWSAIEGATRHLTNQNGELYVITGPLFSGTQIKRIGGRVLVPTKLYKAIYNPSSGKGAAYLVTNTASNDYEVISIAQLEQLSGLNLFPQMTSGAKEKAMDLPDPQERHGGSYNNTTNKDIIYLIEKLLKRMF
jgi:endonuclease G